MTTTTALQPSEEAPLKGHPRSGSFRVIRDLSSQDLRSPGPSAYTDPLEELLLLSSFSGRKRNPDNLQKQ